MKSNPRTPGKTEIIHVIQGNYGYGHGWEDESAYPDTAEGRKSARADLKQYRASGQGSHRIITRRVLRATQEPYRRTKKPNARVHGLARHVVRKSRATPPARHAPKHSPIRLGYGVSDDVAERALAQSLPVRVIVSWPGDIGRHGNTDTAAINQWVRDRFTVPRGFRLVAASPWRVGAEGVMAILLVPSTSTTISPAEAIEVRAVLGPKSNGSLSRSRRACSARGAKLRRSGDSVAAARLSSLCRKGSGRKRNGLGDSDFEYVELDGNMSPRTVEYLKELLAERLPESYRIMAHHGSEEYLVLTRRKITPNDQVSFGINYGKAIWRIPKKRMMTLLPSLLRSRTDMEQRLGSSILSTLEIGVV